MAVLWPCRYKGMVTKEQQTLIAALARQARDGILVNPANGKVSASTPPVIRCGRMRSFTCTDWISCYSLLHPCLPACLFPLFYDGASVCARQSHALHDDRP